MRAALVRASIESADATRALEEITQAKRMARQYEKETDELEALTQVIMR